MTRKYLKQNNADVLKVKPVALERPEADNSASLNVVLLGIHFQLIIRRFNTLARLWLSIINSWRLKLLSIPLELHIQRFPISKIF